MKTINKQLQEIKGLSAAYMHNNSKKWLSELEFVKDEEMFFDDLIKSYTLQLIGPKHFEKSKEYVDKLSRLHKKTEKLIRMVKSHERKLKIMVDVIEQPREEESYREDHEWLSKSIDQFFMKYNIFKTKLFKLIKSILKEQKQKLLLQ